MTGLEIIRATATPQYALCRCFCRHFATLTGLGLAPGQPEAHPLNEDGDDD